MRTNPTIQPSDPLATSRPTTPTQTQNPNEHLALPTTTSPTTQTLPTTYNNPSKIYILRTCANPTVPNPFILHPSSHLPSTPALVIIPHVNGPQEATHEHPMTDELRIIDLVEEILNADRTPEDVCFSEPHLLPFVKDRLNQCPALDARIEELSSSTDLPPSRIRRLILLVGLSITLVMFYKILRPT